MITIRENQVSIEADQVYISGDLYGSLNQYYQDIDTGKIKLISPDTIEVLVTVYGRCLTIPKSKPLAFMLLLEYMAQADASIEEVKDDIEDEELSVYLMTAQDAWSAYQYISNNM